jgi:hypothetical protein
VRRGRPGQRNRPGGGGQGNRPGGPRSRGGSRPGGADRARGQDNVEKPRTNEQATSAEGREQPVIEPQTETTPAPVADAPKSTTRKKQVEDPTKLDSSGTKGEHGGAGGEGSGSPGSKGGRS